MVVLSLPNHLNMSESADLLLFLSITHTHEHKKHMKPYKHTQNGVCQLVYIRSEADWGNTHTHTQSAHGLLPALWLINLPDRACPTIKSSASLLCHTQSVPPLPRVSRAARLLSVPLWPLIAFAQNVRAENVSS